MSEINSKIKDCFLLSSHLATGMIRGTPCSYWHDSWDTLYVNKDIEIPDIFLAFKTVVSLSVVKCVSVSEWESLWVRGVSVCVCRGQYSASCWAEVPPKTNLNCLSIFLTSSKLDYGNRTHSCTFTMAAVQWYYVCTTVWAEST